MSGFTPKNQSRLAVTRRAAWQLFGGLALAVALIPAAAKAAQPTSVTMAGSFQKALGCAEDWQPPCTNTQLDLNTDDGVWRKEFTVPKGNYEYKAALNGSWDENYGKGGVKGGDNVKLDLASDTKVKFYYDHESHWVTDSKNAMIASVPGSYQEFLGCPGNWQPGCLKSWLKDLDGDGIYTFSTRAIPAGTYEAKVAINEGWNENYGQDGVSGGPNIPFTVAASCSEMVFSFDSTTKILTIKPGASAIQPKSVTIAGSLQKALGCADDWQPPCEATMLTYDAEDGVWQKAFTVPAGSYEYKVALNGTWDENYGKNAQPGGANIPLNQAAAGSVKFYFDYATKWITDNKTSIIATVPGSFQKYLGCSDNWQPGCLRSWLQDPDGDGIYTFSTRSLPAGDYEGKVAINEGWDENYGIDGAPGGSNIGFTVPSSCIEVFFSWDSVTKKLTISASGAPKGNLKRARAVMVTRDTVLWNLTDAAANTYYLNYSPDATLALGADGVTGGTKIKLALDPSGPSSEVKAKFPYLSSYQAYKVPSSELSKLPMILKGQVAASATNSQPGPGGGSMVETLVDATGMQMQGVLDDLFTYDGPLGVTFTNGVPTIRVWAPTAKNINFHLFAKSSDTAAEKILPMTEGAKGVWEITGEASWLNKFYLFEIDVFVRSTGKFEKNIVTDPYSLSLAINSTKSQIVNLDEPILKPSEWDTYTKPRIEAPEDIVLYELHVRDFSANDPSVADGMKGTYKAFTLADSNGMKHLSALAKAGLTHVHLLPAFDIATVNEDKSQWKAPEGDLKSYPPDSEQQQAAIEPIRDLDGFNWGYDPWHYTVPEGSYSTVPDGAGRILEFRQMVQGLNKTGLRVVMDVVYNHTTASGQDSKSVLDRVVPGYYHRLNADGNVETSTCCANTASEFTMMEKLLIDSVLTWTKAYKVDGYRFDLMGHHMKSNILKLRAALDALTLAKDGVDGKSVYVYGEGWDFGEVAGNARGVNATQINMAGTGIGTFSDRARDAVRGGSPFGGLQDQGFATGLFTEPNGVTSGTSAEQKSRLLLFSDQIRVQLAGNLQNFTFQDRTGAITIGKAIDYNGQPSGYTMDPQELISYVEAHDNETFFDIVQTKLDPKLAMSQRVRAQALGLSFVLFGQGVPFIHAGAEILRSKSGDKNSYNSGDWFNKLDFTYQENNWGVGLPPAGDNKSLWPIWQPLLANPAMKPSSNDIKSMFSFVQEYLTIRKSSKLFRLRTASDIASSVYLYNTGASQIPGFIIMKVTDPLARFDRQRSELFLFFNQTPSAQNFAYASGPGYPYMLHPVQAKSADAVTKTAKFDIKTGVFSVPAKTASVFMLPRGFATQVYYLVYDINKLVGAGALTQAQAQPLWTALNNAIAAYSATGEAAGLQALGAFIQAVAASPLDAATKAQLSQETLNIITFFQSLA